MLKVLLNTMQKQWL